MTLMFSLQPRSSNEKGARPQHFRRKLSGLLIAALVSSATIPALADTDEERAGARAAATEGAKAMQEGRYAEAADLFARAEALLHAPPHLLYLGRAQVKLGKLVQAQEAFRKVVREPLDARSPKAFLQAQADADRELKELEPRIPTVTVRVQGADPGTKVEVTEDGVPISAALVGIPRPINPGQHTLQAKAGNKSSDPVVITVAEGAREAVNLTLKDSALAPTPPATTPPEGAVQQNIANDALAPQPVVADTGTSSSGGSGMRIGAYTAAGVGVLGLALGTVFTLKSSSKNDDAKSLFDKYNCGQVACSQRNEIQSLRDDRDSAKTLGLVGFIVGGVGLATGATLFVLSNRKQEESAPTTAVWLGPSSAGVRGTF